MALFYDADHIAWIPNLPAGAECAIIVDMSQEDADLAAHLARGLSDDPIWLDGRVVQKEQGGVAVLRGAYRIVDARVSEIIEPTMLYLLAPVVE